MSEYNLVVTNWAMSS